MKKHWEELLYRLRSMRVQLFVVLLVVGLVPVILFSNIMIHIYDSKLISQRTDELQSYGTVLSNLILSTGYLSGRIATEVDQEAESIANIYQGRVLIIDQNLYVMKDTYGLEEGKTMITTEVIRCFTDHQSKYVNDLGEYIQLTMPVLDTENGKTIGVVILTFSTQSYKTVSNVMERRTILLIFSLAICLIIIAIYYSLYVTKPFQKVTKSINEITDGDMDVKLEVRSYSELRLISESFNQMIDVIQQQDEARQNFASNVSDELKTPLASMKVISDSLLTQEGMPEELYREFLVDITNEIERMTNIINDLLMMVKLDKNSAQMQISNISINDLIEQLLKRLRPIAAERNIELVYESYRPIMADVDEVKLSIALNNLIENAVKYNYDDGWVRVTLNADHKFFYIKIEDSGVGIPEDVQDKIFERFFRVDTARSRDTGGTGLGLSLTRSTILLHRGSIKLYSKEKEGSTFTVRIPLNYTTNS
ncbi:MAG: HAMP domain-containing histidine kinase [Lachnospiraceae bacterium]|nr:HAMP domain-containing histidine kinase [Lachnospiraceae bacterium]